MISAPTWAFIIWTVCAILLGGCFGAIIIYKYEEAALKTMFNQCHELEVTNQKIIDEYEEYKNTRSMVDSIDDVPNYLRNKYDVITGTSSKRFTDCDEDVAEIYI